MIKNSACAILLINRGKMLNFQVQIWWKICAIWEIRTKTKPTEKMQANFETNLDNNKIHSIAYNYNKCSILHTLDNKVRNVPDHMELLAEAKTIYIFEFKELKNVLTIKSTPWAQKQWEVSGLARTVNRCSDFFIDHSL